jgi:hypothetical protein
MEMKMGANTEATYPPVASSWNQNVIRPALPALGIIYHPIKQSTAQAIIKTVWGTHSITPAIYPIKGSTAGC